MKHAVCTMLYFQAKGHMQDLQVKGHKMYSTTLDEAGILWCAILIGEGSQGVQCNSG